MNQSIRNRWKTVLRRPVYSIVLVGIIALTVGLPLMSQAAETKSAPNDALLANEPWIGDFDAMAQKRQIRVLVAYSKTFFFLLVASSKMFKLKSSPISFMALTLKFGNFFPTIDIIIILFYLYN